MTWFIIALFVIIIFFFFVRKKQNDVEKSFQQRFQGTNIISLDKNAMYIARKSDGKTHFRGVGYLVLTEDELYFERHIDRKIIIIPVPSIIKVEESETFGGQNPGKIMLKVVFKAEEGEEDAIAWKIDQPEEWIGSITKVIKKP